MEEKLNFHVAFFKGGAKLFVLFKQMKIPPPAPSISHGSTISFHTALTQSIKRQKP